MTRILGPLPCRECRRMVWWDRVGSELQLMETASRRHLCETRGQAPIGKSAAAQKIAA